MSALLKLQKQIARSKKNLDILKRNYIASLNRLQDGCHHRQVIEMEGVCIQNYEEPGAAPDIHGPKRLCLNCGISEEGIFNPALMRRLESGGGTYRINQPAVYNTLKNKPIGWVDDLDFAAYLSEYEDVRFPSKLKINKIVVSIRKKNKETMELLQNLRNRFKV